MNPKVFKIKAKVSDDLTSIYFYCGPVSLGKLVIPTILWPNFKRILGSGAAGASYDGIQVSLEEE